MPGVTDRVSTLTASFVDRSKHALSTSASLPFRLAFTASLVALALAGLGPATINISTTSVDLPISLQIGNLTRFAKVNNGAGSATTAVIQRAWEITHLEKIEQAQFGYTTDANWVVGWPPINLGNSSGTVQYPSDAVHFQHSCTWEAPVLNNVAGTWKAGGMEWKVWTNEQQTDDLNAGM